MATNNSSDFNVAIVGGGMVGMLCAAILNRAGVPVDVYESAPKFSEVGAGVALGRNAVRVLKTLGLYEAVVDAMGEENPIMDRFHYVAGEGEHEYLFEYNEGAFGMSIMRPVFIQAMENLVDPKICHLNKRYTGLTKDSESGAYTLSFTDGTTATADLVIGADGIRSNVRAEVLGRVQKAAYMHTNAYRGLIPLQKLKEDGLKTDLAQPTTFVGKNHHIIAFPLEKGTMANLVLFSADYEKEPGSIEIPKEKWVEEESQEFIEKDFAGFGHDLTVMIKNMNSYSKWAIHATQPVLETFTKDNIVLVGDAAHGMLPPKKAIQRHLGAGFGQGCEDAYFLCSLLTNPSVTREKLPHVLSLFDKFRRPRANKVLEMSTETGRIYDSYGPGGLSKEELEKALQGRWDYVWFYDTDKDIANALEELSA